MKKFLLGLLTVSMLSTALVAVGNGTKDKLLYFSYSASDGKTAMNENGTLLPHNRIEVVRNTYNSGSLLLGLLGAAGLVASVYEGSLTGSLFSAYTLVDSAMAFSKRGVRIKRYQDKTLVGSIAITGEPAVLEKAIALEQAGVDAANKESKMKKSPHLNADSGQNLAEDIVVQQEKDGLVA